MIFLQQLHPKNKSVSCASSPRFDGNVQGGLAWSETASVGQVQMWLVVGLTWRCTLQDCAGTPSLTRSADNDGEGETG